MLEVIGSVKVKPNMRVFNDTNGEPSGLSLLHMLSE
jgi:hypothetical protein